MGYALYTYHWRADSIRRGGRGPFDDRLGPVSTMRHRVVCHANSKLGILDTTLCCTSRFAALDYTLLNVVFLIHMQSLS
jgi:hypothetical protein